MLGDIFLANGDTGPSHAHESNPIDIVLVKVNLKGTEMTIGPLGQPPLLHNLLGRLQLGELANDVAIED